jgi:hypothetical protein
MSMKMVVPYSMVNEVVEFEQDRRIAWQPRMRALAWLSGGRVWRYDLEPVDGGTCVTETWDISKEKSRAFIRSGGKKARRDMEATLARIEEIVTTPG